MKLEKKEIQFINTYLQNSEIEFTDVRMEMVDHVASEVENKMKSEDLDFYHAFKNYMMLYKKEHQKTNIEFKKVTDKRILKEIISFYQTPASILLLITMFSFLKIVGVNYDLNYFLKFGPAIILIGLTIYYFSIRFYLGRKERYSGIERLSIILNLFIQMHQFLLYSLTEFETNSNLNILLLSFDCTLVYLFIALINKYNLKYTTLYKKI
ncbi:hypothetical protein [Cellulophaga baltica]|uniref:Uncharacterized protein n=1 Tax=Cellulophaga baltica 18 TaxID=1348584 RepID=A0AAU8RE28_9FLAO|nr:hypothetical protein [Cellulophaga baltica]AIZ41053.1 hypothetical protein M666_05445 [Cellulophaga baltica 18]